MLESMFNFENAETRERAKKMLLFITSALQNHNIEYFLEGGTLLGIVRDGKLLDWDHDLDLSINQTELHKLVKLKLYFAIRGYKLSIRRSDKTNGPLDVGDIRVIKIKPMQDYILQMIKMHKTPSYTICDIFIKYYDNGYYYWQAKNKIMRVKSHYYEGCDMIPYGETMLKGPAYHKEYLTEKYGDWSVPVKIWDCAENEKTIWTPESDSAK